MADMMRDFGDWLNQPVRFYPHEGNDEYGEPQYGIETLVMARVEQKRRRILLKDDVVAVSTVTVYMPSLPTISEHDKLKLPDDRTPVIIAVDSQPDEYGNTYYQAVYTA